MLCVACCSCLLLSAFSYCHRLALLAGDEKRSRVRKPSPASIQPLHHQDPYSASSWPCMGTGTSRSQAKLQGISEQQWSPEARCVGPPVCGHALASANHCPTFGSNSRVGGALQPWVAIPLGGVYSEEPTHGVEAQ